MAPKMKEGVLTVALQECKYANSILSQTRALAIKKKAEFHFSAAPRGKYSIGDLYHASTAQLQTERARTG